MGIVVGSRDLKKIMLRIFVQWHTQVRDLVHTGMDKTYHQQNARIPVKEKQNTLEAFYLPDTAKSYVFCLKYFLRYMF